MNLKELYFGCVIYDFNSGEIKPFNLFNSLRVLRSIAIYKTRKGIKIDNPLRFCFFDLFGRVEYEFEIGGPFSNKTRKISLWDLYVVPNKELLMKMVNEVNEDSCKKFLKEYSRC